MKGPHLGLSQQAGEAEGSLILEVQGRVGSSLTTTEAGRALPDGPGLGKRSGKVYVRNQRLKPSHRTHGSNLGDAAGIAVHAVDVGAATSFGRYLFAGPEATLTSPAA